MVWPILYAVAGSLLGIAAIVVMWLSASLRSVVAQRIRLQTQLDKTHQEAEQHLAQLRDLQQQAAAADRDLAIAQQTNQHLKQRYEEDQKKLGDTFQSLATRVLNESVEHFHKQAQRTFKGEQQEAASQLELRKQAVQKLIEPLDKRLQEYSHKIQQIEKDRKEDKGTLTQQLKRLSEETSDLTRALRHPGARGQWGQITLRRVVELAGMNAQCDFEEQVCVQDPQGNRLQPDMVVRLPNERAIVVDAKTPFDSFYSALESQDENDRQGYLLKHAQAIEGHVKQLAAKQYSQHFERSPDFVVLFLPAESILYAAVQVRPGLIEAAMNKKIVIATPSILMAVLRAIATGWQEQTLTENAKEISKLGKELHRRLATVFEHYEKLGDTLKSTVDHYNKLGASLESRVLPQARKFAQLGADSSKQLPTSAHQIENPHRPTIKIVTGKSQTTSSNPIDA